MLRRYSTGSNLNTYSALIQNFYSQETAPYPAIHIALNTGTQVGEEAGVKAYVRLIFLYPPFCDRAPEATSRSSPVGVFPKPENAVFVPIPVTLRANDAERSGRASAPRLYYRFLNFFAQCTSLKTLQQHRTASSRSLRVRSMVSSKCSIVC